MHATLNTRARGTSITFLRDQADGLKDVAQVFKAHLHGQDADVAIDIGALTVGQMRDVLGVYIALRDELDRRREYV